MICLIAYLTLDSWKWPSHCITAKQCNLLPLWFTVDVPNILNCWLITYNFNSYFCKHPCVYSFFLCFLFIFIHSMHWKLEGVRKVAEKTVITIKEDAYKNVCFRKIIVFPCTLNQRHQVINWKFLSKESLCQPRCLSLIDGSTMKENRNRNKLRLNLL